MEGMSHRVTVHCTPFEYKTGGIFVKKDYYVMSTYGYWGKLPFFVLDQLALIKKNKLEDRAIFKAKNDVTLPIVDNLVDVLMVENYYMN